MLITLQVASLIALQIPGVQTFAAQTVTGAVSRNINGRISIGKVYFVFFNRLIVKDISIVSDFRDQHLDSLAANFGYSDTLLACNKLSVTLSAKEFIKGNIKLNTVRINGGEFNLQTEWDKRTNLDRIFKIEKNKQKDTAASSLNLLANTLKISNFRFTMKNYIRFVPKGDSTVNFANLDVRDIYVDISDVHLKSDTLYAQVNNISGTDVSGLKLGTLKGKARVCGKEAMVSDFYLADSYSVINSKYFYMKYSSPKDFSDFTGKVRMGLDLSDSYLSFRTIGKIAPSLEDSRMAYYLNGAVDGPVCSLKLMNFLVTSDSGDSFVEIDGRINGLPDVSRTMVVAQVKRSSMRFDDLSDIIASIHDTGRNKFLASLSPGENYSFSGNVVGMLDDFVANGEILSSKGNVYLDLLFRNERNTGSRFSGKIVTDKLDAGYILSNEKFGEVTMNTGFDVLFKRNGGGIDLKLDSINVVRAGFNNYDYTNIQANGHYTGRYFNGTVMCDDPNLKFIFGGLFTFAKNIDQASKYNFFANITYANLVALNFDKKNTVSELSVKANSRFINLANGSIKGNVVISDASYKSDNGKYSVKKMTLNSLNSASVNSIDFTAPFARAKYSGPEPLDIFVKKAIDVSLHSKMDNFFNRDTSAIYSNGEYNFSVNTYQIGNLCRIINRSLYIEDSSKVSFKLDSTNVLRANLSSGRMALGSNYLKDFNLFLASSYDSPTDINLFTESVKVAGVKMDSTTFKFVADSNLLTAGFSFNNLSDAANSADVGGSIHFQKGNKLDVDIKSGSNVCLHGEKWELSPSRIFVSDSLIRINDFCISNNGQSFTLDGGISKYSHDSLNFELENFNIGIVNMFLNKKFDIQGHFSGNGILSDLYSAPKAFFDIKGSSVSVYGTDVGNIKMMSKWLPEDKSLNLMLITNRNNENNFSASGFYKPETSYLNLTASLNDLSVSYFEPFLSDLISKTSGSLSGRLNLAGPLDKLALVGENCRFNKLGFILNFTQVPYTIDGPFSLNERGLVFQNLPIVDRFGSKGVINGRLIYDYFRNVALDTKVNFTNLQCLDTKEKDNEFFYGSAFATGSVHLKGPLSNIAIDIKAVSNKRTSIHIPLSNSATAIQTNLLNFVEPDIVKYIDPYDTLVVNNTGKMAKKSNLQVAIQTQVTSDAEIMIEIDKSVGDVIKAKGNGNISLDIDPQREIFDIYGDYHVTQGSYKFVLAGLATRDFTLQPGGVINFNGNISNTNLNLDAVYNTKTSINPLIADTSSVQSRRNVDCIIGMRGNMMNPQLNFRIDVPDLDPTTKIRVESALNTQGKIQKQFMSLLVYGTFIPDEQSGIANNSSMLYSNAAEMLSNQINNIFYQLGIPLDLGLNYQPGDRGIDFFDVAVSTQLFNNRLTINGNIGNDPYAQSRREVIGNIDVGIKLDNSGNIRLDLFSHAEDQYSSYSVNGTSTQRSGIGIVYQKEFNSFRTLLRGKSKAEKAYIKQEKMRRRLQKRAERSGSKQEQ